MAAIENFAMVTPTPVFQAQELRRDLTIATAWTPVVEGGVTNYNLFTCNPGSSISASGNFWRCCAASTNACAFPTGCRGATFYYPSITATCVDSGVGCGQNFLLPSVGATNSYTQYSCATPGIAGNTYYIESPAAAQATAPGGAATAPGGATTAPGGGATATAAAPANTAATPPKSGTSTSKAQFGTIARGLIFFGMSAFILLQ